MRDQSHYFRQRYSPMAEVERLSTRGQAKPELDTRLKQCEERIKYALKRKLRDRDMPHFHKLLALRAKLMEEIDNLPTVHVEPDTFKMTANMDAFAMKQGARMKPRGLKRWS